jgi:hypothetical protein
VGAIGDARLSDGGGATNDDCCPQLPDYLCESASVWWLGVGLHVAIARHRRTAFMALAKKRQAHMQWQPCCRCRHLAITTVAKSIASDARCDNRSPALRENRQYVNMVKRRAWRK